jgi:hypothetical protein
LAVASSILVALAKFDQMWSIALARDQRRLDVYSGYLLQQIHNSSGIKAVKSWSAHLSAILTPLIVYSGIVP